LNAHDISKALEDVHYMARSVKAKSIDTKDYILTQDDLQGDSKVAKLTSD
jgi:hypothetical protein